MFSGGETAIVTSTAGLERLADASSDVTLDDGADGLSLGIAQGGAFHAILLADVEGGGSRPVKAPPPTRPAGGDPVAAGRGRGSRRDRRGDRVRRSRGARAGTPGRALVTGRGSSADEVVLAGSDGWRAAASNGGDDVLVGDARDNWLVGGTGADVMHGGAGADDFRFFGRDADDAGSDVILDLDFGAGDRIVLSGYDAARSRGAAPG